MSNNCLNQNPCNPCLACDPLLLSSQCGDIRMIPGYGIHMVAAEDKCSLTISSFVPYANGIPSNGSGDDGDVRIDSNTNQFYWKINGIWQSPNSIGSGAVWGLITGTLADQTDLQAALDAKESLITGGLVTQYWRGDKTWQVLNTSVVPESGDLYFTTERAQDSVGAALTDTATIDFTYNDGANTIEADFLGGLPKTDTYVIVAPAAIVTLTSAAIDISPGFTIKVYRNGLRQLVGGGNDYTIAGNVITFTPSLVNDEIIIVDYATN